MPHLLSSMMALFADNSSHRFADACFQQGFSIEIFFPVFATQDLSRSQLFIVIISIVISLIVGLNQCFLKKDDKETEDPYKRGRFMITLHEARDQALMNRSADDGTLWWGGVAIPSRLRHLHFAVFGRTGAGKTLSLRILMQTAFELIGVVPDRRAIVYDPKLDMVSVLHGMNLRCPIKILCPFDLRSVAWDIAVDCTDPATATEIATILIPEEEGHNRYFPDAARDLLQGVPTSFLAVTPRVWTLRDVLHAMNQPNYLRQILARCPSTKRLLSYLDNERSFPDVQTTISTKLGSLEIIAACWSRANEKISLEEWQKGDFILVLGNHEKLRSILDMVNRIIFKRVSEIMLAADNNDTRQTWLILDEIRETKKIDGLSRLLTQGRSKGVSVVLGVDTLTTILP